MKGDEIAVLTERGNTFRVTEDHASDCRACGEPILWCVTVKGKKMPVDLPEEPGQPTVSHFATCPHGDEWRKPR